MDWKDGTIEILEEIVTSNSGGKFNKYYPVIRDKAKLEHFNAGVHTLTKVKGFDPILNTRALTLYPTRPGHLKSDWIRIDNKDPINVLELSLELTRFDVKDDCKDPYPVLFTFYWKENGKILSFGLEGGGW